MNDILPIEVIFIIIEYISTKNYNIIRNVCKIWYEFVENSNYQEILKFIRMIQQRPNCIHYWHNATISFYDGKVMFTIGEYINNIRTERYIYVCDPNIQYSNTSLTRITDKHNIIHKINNNFILNDTYMTINGNIKLYFSGGYGSHIIKSNDNDIVISTSEGILQYDKINNEWLILSKFDENLHIKDNISYRKDNNKILFIKNNIHIGSIILLTNKFGFGPNYFVCYKNDKVSIWKMC